MPDVQLREILEAATAAIGQEDDAGRQEMVGEPEDEASAPTIKPLTKAVIVRARKPRPRR
jgi:hypothetical protein